MVAALCLIVLIVFIFAGRLLWHLYKFGRINNDAVKLEKDTAITDQQQFDVFTEFSKIQDSNAKLKKVDDDEIELHGMPIRGQTRNKVMKILDQQKTAAPNFTD